MWWTKMAGILPPLNVLIQMAPHLYSQVQRDQTTRLHHQTTRLHHQMTGKCHQTTGIHHQPILGVTIPGLTRVTGINHQLVAGVEKKKNLSHCHWKSSIWSNWMHTMITELCMELHQWNTMKNLPRDPKHGQSTCQAVVCNTVPVETMERTSPWTARKSS